MLKAAFSFPYLFPVNQKFPVFFGDHAAKLLQLNVQVCYILNIL